MRVGVIGAGRIGRSHAVMLKKLVEDVTVTDIDPGRAESMADEIEIGFIPDVADMLADTDAIVVAAATSAHVDLVVAGVDAGLPVFCEKPIALDLGTMRRVVDHVRVTGGKVQIGFQRRFDRGYVAARELVGSERLGTLLYVRTVGHDPEPPPEAYIAVSGGIFRDFSVHDFDALRFVTDEEVVEVYAVGALREHPVFGEYDDVDTAHAVLTLESGAFAVVSNTRRHPLGYDVRMELYGSEDSGVVGWDEQTPLRSLEPSGPPPPAAPHQGFLGRFRAAYEAELRAFVDLAAGGSDQVACTVEDAEKALQIAVACDTSRRRRRPIRVRDVA